MIKRPTHFHDGEPIPEGYLEWLARASNAAIEHQERYGGEEERIAHPEDWPEGKGQE